MNFWKKLFAGMGFVCGFLVFETMSLAYHNSRRRHKNRKGRCRRNSFWDTLTRYMIFAWIYDGVKKSREQVGRRYYRRTGNEFRPSYDSCVHHAGAGSQLGFHSRVGAVHEVHRHPPPRRAHRHPRQIG